METQLKVHVAKCADYASRNFYLNAKLDEPIYADQTLPKHVHELAKSKSRKRVWPNI